MEEKILALHPFGKAGTNISRVKYDVIRSSIVAALSAGNELTFKELTRAVVNQLDGKFDGSISWYVTTVKLDLEARDVIERVPGKSPQRLRLL